jgi:hypothetical protein
MLPITQSFPSVVPRNLDHLPAPHVFWMIKGLFYLQRVRWRSLFQNTRCTIMTPSAASADPKFFFIFLSEWLLIAVQTPAKDSKVYFGFLTVPQIRPSQLH